ncbi:MAG: hypothetical protein IJU76_15985 [Desulfovibrionaceae bacterium]|nr:hypothetical protein [Desulfovibrionaceae bacterium]
MSTIEVDLLCLSWENQYAAEYNNANQIVNSADKMPAHVLHLRSTTFTQRNIHAANHTLALIV